MATALSPIGIPRTAPAAFAPKPEIGLPPVGVAVEDFDVWRQGYAGATVVVLKAGTTTKARIFSDPELTIEIENPQVLLTLEDEVGRRYGKWSTAVYSASPYWLQINDTGQTSVRRPPLVSLAGADGTYTLAQSKRGLIQRTLRDWLDDRVDALAFGAMGDSPAENTATLTAAIGASAAAGGGEVLLPPGSFEILPTTLPARVVLVGHGRGATTLRCMQAEPAVTIGGAAAGFRRLTLDGINLVPASVGVAGSAIQQVIFDDVEVKRFDIGLRFRGGQHNRWRDLYLANCNRGADLLGHLNVGQTDAGSAWSDNQWLGGEVSFHTSHGVNVEFFDAQASDFVLQAVVFHNNSGIGLRIEGGQAIALRECSWYDNITNIDVRDDTDASQRPLNITWDLFAEGCWMLGGIARFTNTCRQVQFFRCDFADLVLNLVAPEEAILLRDCTEDAAVQITGSAGKVVRFAQNREGTCTGVSTDGTAITAWERDLEPGEVILAEARVIGRQRNGVNYAIYHIEAGATRPASNLDYDNQTVNFNIGEIIVGGVSGARARIVADTDAGTSGTLALRDIDGEFINGEVITDGLGGSATADGVLAFADAELAGSHTEIRAAVETNADWDCAFDVNGGKFRLRVTGDANETVEWTASVKIVVP